MTLPVNKRALDDPYEPSAKRARRDTQQQSPLFNLVEDLFQHIFKTFNYRDLLNFERTSKESNRLTKSSWIRLRDKSSFNLSCLEEDECREKWQYIIPTALQYYVDQRYQTERGTYQRYRGLMQKFPPLGASLWAHLSYQCPTLRSNFQEQFENYTFQEMDLKGGDFLLQGLHRTNLEENSLKLFKEAILAGVNKVSYLAFEFFGYDNEDLFYELGCYEIQNGTPTSLSYRPIPEIMYARGDRSYPVMVGICHFTSTTEYALDEALNAAKKSPDFTLLYAIFLKAENEPTPSDQVEWVYDKLMADHASRLDNSELFNIHLFYLFLGKMEKAKAGYKKVERMEIRFNDWEKAQAIYENILRNTPLSITPIWLLTSAVEVYWSNGKDGESTKDILEEIRHRCIQEENSNELREFLILMPFNFPMALSEKFVQPLAALFRQAFEKIASPTPSPQLIAKCALVNVMEGNWQAADTHFQLAIHAFKDQVPAKLYRYAFYTKLLLEQWEGAKSLFYEKVIVMHKDSDSREIDSMQNLISIHFKERERPLPIWVLISFLEMRPFLNSQHTLLDTILARCQNEILDKDDCLAASELAYLIEGCFNYLGYWKKSKVACTQKWEQLADLYSQWITSQTNASQKLLASAGFVESQLGHFEKADDYYNQVVKPYGTQLPPLPISMERVRVKAGLKQWGEADALTKTAGLDREKNLPVRILEAIAEVQFQLKQYTAAEMTYGKFIWLVNSPKENEFNGPHNQAKLAFIKCQLGKYNQAEEYLENIVNRYKDIDNVDWQLLENVCSLLMDNYGDALPPEFLANTAFVKHKLGKLADAKRFYQQALTLLNESLSKSNGQSVRFPISTITTKLQEIEEEITTTETSG